MPKTLAIIGGSGFYQLGEDSLFENLNVPTPFGSTSSEIQRYNLGETEIFFIARHGLKHSILPSEVNYRANIWALKSLGASWCLGLGAVGSLQEEIAPGDLVICDQFIDRTRSRNSSFFGEGIVAHVSFADPVCSTLHSFLGESAQNVTTSSSSRVHKTGTYLCMEGPAFSTRAESRLYRNWECSVVGMTALTEAKLAREAELAYATLAMVTDYDCWRSESADIDIPELLATLKANSDLARRVITDLATNKLPEVKPSEAAAKSLEYAIMTDLSNVPKETLEKLEPILARVQSGK